ncbi:unnamed protein product [Colias eurytheme]|nr:unnamed protein product [Colias eurytheme]
MTSTTLKPRPPVPGSPAIPGYDSGHGHGGAGGAKNLRKRYGYQRRRLDLATYNTRTLRNDEKIYELEEEISGLKWDIIGLSEVRREGEDTLTLKSGNLFYHREGDQKSQGGIGFLVNKSLANNISEIGSVSARVAYLTLKMTKRYSLKVIQVYAPTTAYPDEEVESMYEDIAKAINIAKTYYTVIMGDFNAKVGTKNADETRIGLFGTGVRNPRGQMLLDFMEREGLYLMNSFFKKPKQRKWTWISPDGSIKNEIDFILSTKRHIFNNVSVISRLKTGSDHRLVRGTLNINVRMERSQLVRPTFRRLNPSFQKQESFQLELQNKFEALQDLDSVDDLNDSIVKTIYSTGLTHFKTPRKTKNQKISEVTLKLMEERRQMRLQTSKNKEHYSQLNKQISKSLRYDIRKANTIHIQDTIERNKGSKVFARDLRIGHSHMTQLKTESNVLVSSKSEMLGVIERYYSNLYASQIQPPTNEKDKRAKLTRHHTDDIPDVSFMGEAYVQQWTYPA